MKGLSAFLLIAIMMAFSTYTSAQEMDSLITETSYAELSMILLQNVRDGNPTQKIEDKLATVSREELNSDLDTESEKKAFG